MSEFYLFRHGQASFGSQDYDRLSPTGVRQSKVLARFLFDQSIRFDAVYMGRMHRHQETARPFCECYGSLQPDLETASVMAEFDEYDSEALLIARRSMDSRRHGAALRWAELRQDKKAFQAYFAETVRRWITGAFDDDERVESFGAFCRRVENGLHRIMEKQGRGKRVAVFTSGGPISVAVRHALMLADEKTIEVSWQITNASLTVLKYSSRSMALSIFNNATHLWLEKDPSLITYR